SDLGGFEYRNEASFRCWLFSVALNKIREKGRFHDAACRTPTREEGSWNDSGGLPGRHAGGYTPSEYAIARESEEQFEAAFDLLSEDHREIIVLSRILRLSHAEIAERLGRSEVAVRSLLSRALVALSARLQRSTKHG
ncbi:MAG: RNA polymerase sigma factor, partial [Planctomycetota bacterium]